MSPEAAAPESGDLFAGDLIPSHPSSNFTRSSPLLISPNSTDPREGGEGEERGGKCGEGARKSKVDQAGCRVAFRTKSELEVMDDGFKWRKYGMKMVKNSTNPRNYYKCASAGCNVKKRVERDSEDPSYLITTYNGVHNHESLSVRCYDQAPLMVPNCWTLQPPPSQYFSALCQGDVLVSREVPKRQCMAESVLSFVNSTTCISSTDFDAPANSPHLGSAHQSGPIVFNSEKKDTMEGLNKECLNKCVLSLDDSTKQIAIKDFYEGKDSCASNSSEKPGNQVDSCGSVGGGPNNLAVQRSESFVETSILSFSAASAPSANDSEIDKLWHYRDPNGKIQGPFCVVQLRKWSTTGCFPPETRIWHVNNEEVDSVLLTDLLSGKLHKVFPLQSNNSLPSKGVVARGGARLNCFDDRSCGSVNTTGMDGNKVLGPYVCDNESVNSDGWGSQSSNWTAPVNNKKSRWAKLRLLWKAARVFTATAKEFSGANAKVNFLLVEENSRNPDVKSNCNQSLGTLTTVKSSSQDDCAGIPPDLNTRKRSSWANLRLLWKAGRAFATAKEFCGANAEVDFPVVEENKNLDIKKGNCNQSSSIVTTVELSSRDDIAEMLPDLKSSKSASSSRGPIGLQDGEHIWLLDPLEQSTKNVAHAVRADPCSLTASLPEKKMVRRTLKRKYRIISVMFKNHRQHFGRRFEGAAKSFRAMRICRKHGINRVSRVKHIHKQHGIQQWPFRQKWATRKGYSLGDERLFEVSSPSMDKKLDPGLLFIKMSKFARSSPQTLALPDGGEIVVPIASSPSEFFGTNDRPHLVRQDQSGSTASHYERKNTRGTPERQEITMSSCSVEDLQQHFGCKHRDAVKRLDVSISMFKRTCRQHRGYLWPCQIENNDSLARKPFKERHESRFHKLNYLARKLFKVLDVFPLWEQSDNIRHLVRRRRLALKRWVRVKKSQDPSQTLQMSCSGSLTAQSASSLHWPISLPDEGRILSLLEKKTMKKTFKRKCSAMGVSFEDHQQHFCSRCECTANRLGAKPIYEQHGINLVSSVKRIRGQYGILRRTFRKGYSFGGQRPAGVLSLYTEVKLVSRLQFFHMSWLARSSRYPLALRSGSQISGHIAFSSSEFPATNNGAHPSRQDQCGSSASHPEKKRGRETKDGEGENNTISRKDLEQHFGKKREEVANFFGISVSTLKRICRKHGISEWPNRRRNSGNYFPSIQRICREQRIPPWPDWRSNPVFIPPDLNGEKNPSPTFHTLSTDGQITRENEMGGLNSEPNECLPDSFEDPNFQNIRNCSIAEFENPTCHDSHHGHCSDANFHFSAVYNETEAAGRSGYIWEQVSESSNFTFPAYLDAAAPIQPVPPILHPMPHPPIASTQIPRENMGSFEDRTNLLAPQKEPLPAGSSISDLALSQAMHTTPHTTESSEYWRETLASVVGHLMGSQPMPTNPHMTPLVTERQDSQFVKLNATYGEDPINLYLPLMPGIMELKQAVSKQLGLGLDIFKVKYENERGKWILMTHDEDVRELLRLTSSENHDSNRLVVIKVPNTSDFCGNCECDKCRSLKGKKP
ncbi:hypothetical protein Vadar_011828 [Vaccinium darrowii]|uniref:Uncharacterized protein n=1 Tax=Vaccinium darrowii TaxID=229202 RepID=A0ACB7YEG2_9ERIC|nr:hypothetical protein Vadar_011828 [Vaccinium darrowii]